MAEEEPDRGPVRVPGGPPPMHESVSSMSPPIAAPHRRPVAEGSAPPGIHQSPTGRSFAPAVPRHAIPAPAAMPAIPRAAIPPRASLGQAPGPVGFLPPGLPAAVPREPMQPAEPFPLQRMGGPGHEV